MYIKVINISQRIILCANFYNVSLIVKFSFVILCSLSMHHSLWQKYDR